MESAETLITLALRVSSVSLEAVKNYRAEPAYSASPPPHTASVTVEPRPRLLHLHSLGAFEHNEVMNSTTSAR